MNNEVTQPLVSVLMPSYNSKECIAIAIESVLKSTYKTFELIITDDNSTDGTYDIAKAYEQKDKRVKVYLNEKNLGDYPNRNQAASYAKGKYLKYVDHDDYIYPYGLEQLVYYMEQFPEAGYGLCSLNQHKSRIYPFQLSQVETYKMNYFEMELFHKAPLSAIIKREAFEAVGGFTGKPLLGDFEMWQLLSQKFPVVLMPHGVVWYRVHANQESNKLKGDPLKAFQYFLLAEEFIASSDCPLEKKDKVKALNQLRIKKSRSIVSSAKHHSLKKASELKKLSNLTFISILKTTIKSKMGR